MEWFSGIIIVLAVLAIAAWPVTNALSKKKTAAPQEETVEIPQPEETRAVVKGKTIAQENYGSYREPYTVLFYQVAFELENGEELFLEVPENVYDALQPGESDILLTQNGMFLDFGGRFGEPVEPQDSGAQ